MLMWCVVSKGMFSDERVIEIKRGEEILTFIVPARYVEEVIGAERGKVRVEVVTADERKWAILPTNKRDTVPVTTAELTPA